MQVGLKENSRGWDFRFGSYFYVADGYVDY